MSYSYKEVKHAETINNTLIRVSSPTDEVIGYVIKTYADGEVSYQETDEAVDIELLPVGGFWDTLDGAVVSMLIKKHYQ